MYDKKISVVLVTLALFLVSCTIAFKHPITTINYSPIKKIQLKVKLMIADEFRNATINFQAGGSPIVDQLGENLIHNSKIIAQEIFSSVEIASESGKSSLSNPDATLIPKVVLAARSRAASRWGDSSATIAIEWTLKDSNGDLIWVDTVKGESKTSGSVGDEEAITLAFENLFQKSFKAISSSQVIEAYANKKTKG